ncbi:unnamed protein product [Durusdinium trenchii]|uniref:Uncharacterized protein n=1 Tax=Durusdinium trenchii TaxID=1381693 RepID=A0ABP0IQH9_9DINO
MDELLLSPDKAWKLNLVLQRLYLMGAPKVLMACIILLTANSKLDTFTESIEFIEVFSGDGWVSKCMKANGIATVSFDIRLGDPLPGKQDAMDLLSDAGHIGWSSSPTIQCLDLGRLCKKYKDTIAKYGVKSTKQYKSKTGVKRFAGSKALKSTGSYPPKFGLRLARLYPRFIRTRPRFWAHVEENNLNFGIDLFESLPWHDMDWWVDARMESVFRYLRGSHDLKLGGLRSLFPTEI